MPHALANRALALACLLSLACGDGDEDRPRYVAAGPTGAQVSTLNDQQLADVCQSFTAYVDTYVDLDAIAYTACLPGALATSLTSGQCEETLSSCMALFPEPIAIQTTATVDACTDDLRDCVATVEQFESCVNARVDLAVGNYSCSGAGDRGYAQQLDSLATVCTDLDSLCDQYDQQYPGPE